MERLASCFDHISRGLYYHENSERFKGEIRVVIGFMHNAGQNYDSFIGVAREKLKR